MGRKSRRKKERREALRQGQSPSTQQETKQTRRASQLEAELIRISDGNCTFGRSADLPPEVHESHLEDVLAFESLHAGPSLFQGLVRKGIDLPRPEELTQRQCAAKIFEILKALLEIHVLVTGFEDLTPKEAYAKFWHETLWEGCYLEKRPPGAVTVIDASHSLSNSEIERFLQSLQGRARVH